MATPSAFSRAIIANSRSLSRSDKRRGRLVHHQNARVLRQGLGDLDHLLLGDAEAMHALARIDVEADHLEHAARVGVEALAVDRAGQPPARRAAEIDVVRDVEMGNQREFLEDHRDAEPTRVGRRSDDGWTALKENLAGIGGDRAAEHLHQRRLAGAVLAEQHMRLARPDRERDVAQRAHAGIALADAAQFQFRRRGIRLGRRRFCRCRRSAHAAASSAGARSKNILPGFMMFSGSSAPLMARIASTAPPSSVSR